MFIISNTCVGSYIYRYKKQEFNNPFCWNIIDYNSMLNLINNFHSINFNNIEFVDTDAKLEDPTINIDNLVDVHYVHYKNKIYENKINKTRPEQNNVFVDDIFSYSLSKYNQRLERMQLNKKPTFIIQYQPNHKITGNEEEFLKFIENVNSNFNVNVYSNLKIKIKKNNINFININELSILKEPAKLANYILKSSNIL